MNDTNSIINSFVIYTALFGLLILVSICFDDIDELAAQQDQYCEMVSIWKADARKGIAPEQRNGWPPYQGDEFCQK